MFKNITMLKLSHDYAPPPEGFECLLSAYPIRSPGPLELETRGFVSPFSRSEGELTHSHGSYTLLSLGAEGRMLPASVLRDAIAERIADHEVKTGRKPGKRMRNEFREIALGELLPRAFIRKSRVAAYFDADRRILFVDTSSDRAAENVASAVREALGTFPCRPISTDAPISLLLSEWLISGNLPDGFDLGDYVEMKDPSDTATVVRGSHHDLCADEIREHARCGKRVTKLGLTYDGRVSFVIDTSMKLCKLAFDDVVFETLDSNGIGADELMAAEFFLMTAEMRRLVNALDGVFRFAS